MVVLGVTVFIPRSVANTAFAAIKSHELYDDICKIVRKNCYDTYYMVGGMVYRNLAIAYHGKKNSIANTNISKADFDFVVLGKPRDFFVPEGWRLKRNTYTKKNSLTFIYQARNKRLKLDIISIKDIPGGNTVRDYFDFVPLDIQAIAAQPEYKRCFGEGISAIVTKKIRLKNVDGLIHSYQVPRQYAAGKAASMGFQFVDTARRNHRPCSCNSRDLFWLGCQCGGT
jgi:hypothetical protein